MSGKMRVWVYADDDKKPYVGRIEFCSSQMARASTLLTFNVFEQLHTWIVTPRLAEVPMYFSPVTGERIEVICDDEVRKAHNVQLCVLNDDPRLNAKLAADKKKTAKASPAKTAEKLEKVEDKKKTEAKPAAKKEAAAKTPAKAPAKTAGKSAPAPKKVEVEEFEDEEPGDAEDDEEYEGTGEEVEEDGEYEDEEELELEDVEDEEEFEFEDEDDED